MKSVYVPRTAHEKAMQRALLQYRKPQNRQLVLEALRQCGREDLIGYGRDCLVRPTERSAYQRPEGARGPATGLDGRAGTGHSRQGAQAPARGGGKGGPGPAAPARPPKPKYNSKWAKAKKKK